MQPICSESIYCANEAAEVGSLSWGWVRWAHGARAHDLWVDNRRATDRAAWRPTDPRLRPPPKMGKLEGLCVLGFQSLWAPAPSTQSKGRSEENKCAEHTGKKAQAKWGLRVRAKWLEGIDRPLGIRMSTAATAHATSSSNEAPSVRLA